MRLSCSQFMQTDKVNEVIQNNCGGGRIVVFGIFFFTNWGTKLKVLHPKNPR